MKQKKEEGIKIKYIIGIVILFLLVFTFIIPIKKILVPDSQIYGKYFCQTYDDSCISTEGHSTLMKVTLYKYFKLK